MSGKNLGVPSSVSLPRLTRRSDRSASAFSPRVLDRLVANRYLTPTQADTAYNERLPLR
jgi:hypothetical protein